MEKYQLVAHLNIPYRDLRILDPLAPIPYPTTIFIREKALVVNLESIRMIICQDQASPQRCCLSTCPDHARHCLRICQGEARRSCPVAGWQVHLAR